LLYFSLLLFVWGVFVPPVLFLGPVSVCLLVCRTGVLLMSSFLPVSQFFDKELCLYRSAGNTSVSFVLLKPPCMLSNHVDVILPFLSYLASNKLFDGSCLLSFPIVFSPKLWELPFLHFSFSPTNSEEVRPVGDRLVLRLLRLLLTVRNLSIFKLPLLGVLVFFSSRRPYRFLFFLIVFRAPPRI